MAYRQPVSLQLMSLAWHNNRSVADTIAQWQASDVLLAKWMAARWNAAAKVAESGVVVHCRMAQYLLATLAAQRASIMPLSNLPTCPQVYPAAALPHQRHCLAARASA
jgi:hypothetical protein